MVEFVIPEALKKPSATAVDVLLGIYALGKEYATGIALRHWQSLSPPERLKLQVTAAEIAGNDLAASQDCALDLLVLDCANKDPGSRAA